MNDAVIYDLDDTVIDSSHRTPNKPDGTLDLQNYINRRNEMHLDKLLPLVNVMRRDYLLGKWVVICTSRSMDHMDYDYLEYNYIPYSYILSRPWGCNDDDPKLKKHLLLDHFDGKVHGLRMYDDNKRILSMLPTIGMVGIDSIVANKTLKGSV